MASLALPAVTSPLVQYSRFSSTSFYSLVVGFSPGRSLSLCCAVARAELPSSASLAPWRSCQGPRDTVGSAEGTVSHAHLDVPEHVWVPPRLAVCDRMCLLVPRSLNQGTHSSMVQCHREEAALTPLPVVWMLSVMTSRRGWTKREGGWCLLMKCEVQVCSANCLESCSSRSRAVAFK